MEVNQYLSMFIDESKDHLQALNEHLLSLENNPEDLQIVHHIFRSAHTLKGMSATMGFDDMAALTHEMENVLDLVRNEKLTMNEAISDALFSGLDLLEAMVEDIIAGGTGKADVSQLVIQLQALLNADAAASLKQTGPEANSTQSSQIVLDDFQKSVISQSLAADFSVFYIHVSVDENSMLKAARAYMVFDRLETYGEIIHSDPTVSDLEQEKFDHTFTLILVTQKTLDEVQDAILGISEISAADVRALTEADLQERPAPQQTQSTAQIAEAAATVEVVAATPNPSVAKTEVGQPAKQAAVNRTIRVDIEKLDKLMNLFSEMLIDRVRLESLAREINRSELTDTVEHMSRISSDLQNIVLNLRMVPIESVFNRFPRMVRDIAKTLSKKVDLVVTGAETELDRTVVDEIGDPLVHLIRNALDHGLEPVEERKQAGKSETGTMHLRAFHSGNHVIIEIQDDGRGINRDRVLQTALKRGVVTEERASSLRDEEVYQLLFASGFSTAEVVSDLSGRGVGLDVVKSKINKLGGEVSVQSQLGVGTTFSVQLPLTLSIISAMLIKVGRERFAIPLSSIMETATIARTDIKQVHKTPMIHYRESVIPIISLQDFFECPADAQAGEQAELNILIVRKGEKLLAAVVDEFIGQQEIVLKSLGNYLATVSAISGATILGDGQVALIIDPNSLIK